MDKIERYDWIKPGDKGKFKLVDVSVLQIDKIYQRSEISRANTLTIAREFSWTAFNSLLVMERESGELYVVDGQQRLMAVKLRGDIHQVPCMIFKSAGQLVESQVTEASEFLRNNGSRRPVSAVDKFRAAVVCSHDPEIAIFNFLNSEKLKVTGEGSALDNVAFPTTMIQTWKMNSEACKQAIVIQKQITYGTQNPMNNYIHKAIWYLLCKRINVSQEVDKIIRLGGTSAIMRSIREVAIMSGSETASIATSGIGLLQVINHKKKRKISISTDD
jgi:hypothetical protein